MDVKGHFKLFSHPKKELGQDNKKLTHGSSSQKLMVGGDLKLCVQRELGFKVAIFALSFHFTIDIDSSLSYT
jgi:hypothetical protein